MAQVDPQRLWEALLVAAQVVVKYGEAFLPFVPPRNLRDGHGMCVRSFWAARSKALAERQHDRTRQNKTDLGDIIALAGRAVYCGIGAKAGATD